MEPPILDVYWNLGPPIALLVVVVAAVALYLNTRDRLAAAIITIAGCISAFFAPAVPILLGAGYLAYALYTQRGGRPKLSGSDEQ
ncbi:MAG TPA: hypothetical protein K8V11_04320 [Dietzia timorensis]|uniref:Uncharacterized protein n=1 Tax=Dietzia timorensis TaxID=499555 RepID=A0A921JXV1_9ACTN|nr:hypothetical protein [Dietzia timorensis]HJE90213.1 hypothetical protein [Dietzia timorensis]